MVNLCFQCSKRGCDWAFTTSYKLKRHEESHEGKKGFSVSAHENSLTLLVFLSLGLDY